MARTLVQELNELHAEYVVAVNQAVAADDLVRVERLAADYDREAIQLMAVAEGKTHMLPLPARATQGGGSLRRLARRALQSRAA